jgi:type II secretory pathway component PulK
MKLLRTHPDRPRPRAGRRGAALLLSLLVLFVLVAIVFQINVTTGTDARMARNDVGLTTMDLAIESAMLRVLDELQQDGEAAAAGAAGAGAAPPADAGAMGGGPEGGGADSEQASDSREDGWGRPQQTSFDEMDVRLRILVQDEDAKLNLLAMLSEDEDEAEAAYERVVRLIDLCREDTRADIDRSDAERMARAMRDHMERRAESEVPMTPLLTHDERRREIGLPLTLREFETLEPFEPSHFRDFRDEDGTVVHSLGSYLTVWSSLTTLSSLRGSGAGGSGASGAAQGGGSGGEGGEEGGAPAEGGEGATETETGGGGGAQQAEQTPPTEGEGSGAADLSQGPENLTGGVAGYAVNINTAPPAVLKCLFDDRELSPRFWDEVILYRNTEEEQDEEAGEEEAREPVYNELGEEIVPHKVFDKPGELADVEGWLELEGAVRREINTLVLTQSQVFSIFITAVRNTGAESAWVEPADARAEFEHSQGNQLVRTVRAVYWRKVDGDKVSLIPVVRWEVLDYVPFEVLDFPDEDR